MDAQQLRTDFPALANETLYPTSTLNLWLSVGVVMLRADNLANPQSVRWGALVNIGLELFAAHHSTLDAQNDQTAAIPGGVPGLSTGPLTSESVDKVSLAYDAAGALEKDAGHWNLTTYGTRFIRLAKMLGMGPLQVNGPDVAPPFSGPGWPGPILGPGN